MQKILIPDYLDGTVQSKKFVIQNLVNICSYYKSIEPIAINTVKITESMPPLLKQILNHDNALLTFLRSYYGYMNSDRNNYILSKDLAKAFENTNLDLNSKYLPQNFKGYIEIPGLVDVDGCEISGFFIDLNNDYGKPYFTCGYLVYDESISDYAPGHINIELDKGSTIRESLLKYPYVKQDMNPHTQTLITKEYESEFLPYMNVLFNAIIYIANGNQLELDKNEFSKKSSKLRTQKKIFTNKSWYKVGYNFVLPKQYSIDSTIVSGHFRWQPYGPGKTLVKHIFIEPHTRKYK